jgi:two-component system sensor histidine kinase QseC
VKPARSIRARLLIGILLSLLLLLGIAAWGSYAVSKHESEEIFSARLATSARVLDALVAKQIEHATLARPIVVALPRELEAMLGDEGSPLGHPYETKIAFQVWRDDDVLLARSTSAPAQPFGPNEGGFSLRQVAGEPWQVFVLQSGKTWIQVAEKNEVREELMHNLGVAVMTPLIAGAVVLLIVVNLLVVYGLAPLRELAQSIETRAPDALGEIEMEAVPREVAPVVGALNDLLARLRLAFEHERRFTDAAAHELRTPLAALKVHAENLARARSESERDQSLGKLRAGLDRAIRLAEQMLAYSRAQNSSADEQRESVPLAVLLREIIAAHEPLRKARAQSVALTINGADQSAVVFGEPTKLRRLIRNLLDNASTYAPHGSEIEVELSLDPHGVVLRVANTGEPIPAELRERVFEPYYRIPGSPSDGSGLGLAIVREIASQHGAKVDLGTATETSGTAVTVRFPWREAIAQIETARARARDSQGQVP